MEGEEAVATLHQATTSLPLINSQSKGTDVTESRRHLKIMIRFFPPSFQANNTKSPDAGEQFKHMTWKVTADMRQTGQVHTVVAFSSSALTSDEIWRFRVNRRIDIVVSLSDIGKKSRIAFDGHSVLI